MPVELSMRKTRERPLMTETSATSPSAPARAQIPKVRRFRFFRSVSALVMREMATSYGRSPGGYLWAVLEPVAAISIMSFVFSLMLRSPSLGSNFPYFYASGYLIFALYTVLNRNISGAINYSKPLLAYPAVTFVDALLARLVLHMMTQLLVMFVVIGGIIVLFDITTILKWGAIFNALGMAIALAFGIGVLNCFLGARFELWRRIWGIVTRPLFLLSAVLFIPENVPALYRPYLMINPLAHVTSEMRRGLFPTYDAGSVDPLYVYLIAVTCSVLGLIFLLRYYRDIMQM